MIVMVAMASALIFSIGVVKGMPHTHFLLLDFIEAPYISIHFNFCCCVLKNPTVPFTQSYNAVFSGL